MYSLLSHVPWIGKSTKQKLNQRLNTIIEAINICSNSKYIKIKQKEKLKHLKIPFRPNLLNWSGFYLIHFNPFWSTPDPPPNALTGSSLALIKARTNIQILILTQTESCLALIQIWARARILIFVQVLWPKLISLRFMLNLAFEALLVLCQNYFIIIIKTFHISLCE